MVREFEIPLGDANIEGANFRLDNEQDENGYPVPTARRMRWLRRMGWI